MGAGVDDALRREFLHSVPLHEAATGAFMIARHETTFGEFIEFLDAISPEDRERYAPRVDASYTHLGVELSRGEDGAWTLQLTHDATRKVLLRVGEKYRYDKRSERVEHDWLRLPVGGLTRAKAEAYVSWLSSSGKLPGARLCTGDEWERAARGADGRLFAHGDKITPAYANVEGVYPGGLETLGPDTVGSRPDSQSPFGLLDATGNIIEFVAQGTSEEGAGRSWVRGGGYPIAPFTSRISNRVDMPIEAALGSLGVRVCLSAPE